MIVKILEQLREKYKSKIPLDVSPMLATLVDKPFEEKGWLYELKWDGFRALSYLKDSKVEIRSRNNKDFKSKFYPVYEALKKWKINAVVDGEIVVVDENGYPDFDALQTWRSDADGELAYYIFDILWLEGYDLTKVPLRQRRDVLQRIIPLKGILRHSEIIDATAKELYEITSKLNMEGFIAKKADSEYLPGTRSKKWLKIKTQKHQEVIIGGYTRNENSSRKISALLLGLYEDGELIPITPVGTGFTVKMQDEILKKLKPLKTSKCPFSYVPDFNKPSRFRPNPPKAEVTWVKPELVAEITYRTVSSDGSFRHPSFKGLREDKNAKEVVREEPRSTADVIGKTKTIIHKKAISSPGKKERRSLLNPADETQVREVGKQTLKFTNLSKIFWPKEKITKRDLINYYYQVAPYILPYLKNRPQTLNRFPNGIEGKSFYQKDVKGKVPEWVKTFNYYSVIDEREKEFFVATDEASLLFAANLGCIEINPWSSRVQTPDNPDWCIIDLDPAETKFEQVIQAACVTKEVLDSIKVSSFCKTSGSTGLHIYIPLGGKYDYEESKEFGRAIAKVIHSQIPSFTSIERLTVNRKGKMYIDFLQNRPQATVAAPYSLRPRPGATVSMPLHWEEVRKGLKVRNYNFFNTIDRLKEQGDIFKGVLGKGIDLAKAKKLLKQEFKLL